MRQKEDTSKRVAEIDWNTENNLHPFTFDINKMGLCTSMFKEGMNMLEEKIQEELKEPDDFSSFHEKRLQNFD